MTLSLVIKCMILVRLVYANNDDDKTNNTDRYVVCCDNNSDENDNEVVISDNNDHGGIGSSYKKDKVMAVEIMTFDSEIPDTNDDDTVGSNANSYRKSH